VAVAHPGHLRLIFRAKQKHDRLDARKLAKVLYLDAVPAVPAVHVPAAADVRAWRGLVEFRRRLVDRRVAAKNQLRAIFRGLAVAMPRNPWRRRGPAAVRAVALPSAADALRRNLACDEVEQSSARIAAAERALARAADAHPGVKLLTTVPGVGARTAEAFVAYVDRAERFARAKQVGAYFGLVPCQDSSADATRLGHVTGDGPATVRKLLVEAAWQAVRRSPSVRAWFERVAGGDPGRRKVALVAVAHKLCRAVAAMLRTGEAWREDVPVPAGSPPEDRKA
jgi:transposase